MSRETCLIIPAAGRGTRLGLTIPKVFCPIQENVSPFTLIMDATKCIQHDTCLVLSHDGLNYVKNHNNVLNGENVVISIQESPIGMGDAVFSGYSYWEKFKTIIVIWGDQCSINYDTVEKAYSKFKEISGENKILIPLTKKKDPYVDYYFEDGVLTKINQSRELEKCRKEGFSDVGLFILSNTNLKSCWDSYLEHVQLGGITGEINFLPFLPYLCNKCGYIFGHIDVNDNSQSRGLNNQDDLRFFKESIK